MFASEISILEGIEPETQVSKGVIEICESYNNGYKTGLNWLERDKYIPGGPWVFSHSKQMYEYNMRSSNPKVRENEERIYQMAIQSRKVHDAWMLGWHHARASIKRGPG